MNFWKQDFSNFLLINLKIDFISHKCIQFAFVYCKDYDFYASIFRDMTFPKIQSVNFFMDFPIFFDGSFQLLMIGKGLM